jgi:hypothetical protein
MKEDITSYPVNVRLFSSGAVVMQTNNISYLIKQFWFGHLDFGGLLYITHSWKSNILICIVKNIRANNFILLKFWIKTNKLTKILI